MKHDYSLPKARRQTRPRKPIEIAMTPMIDVIFLLLVFFLATASFQVVEKLLPSGVSETSPQQGNADQMPLEPTDDALEQVVIKLEMRADKEVLVNFNGAALPSFEELQGRLIRLADTGIDVPVIIDPSPEVVADSCIRAYDWARSAGLSRVFLATRSAN